VNEPTNLKCTWCVTDDEEPAVVHRVTMLSPAPHICNSQCPWLMANHGKTAQLFYDHEVPGIPSEAEFTYAPWKRARIWDDDLKDGACGGYGSLCHVRMAGTQLREGNAWDVVSRQCSGALVMQQRELLRHVERGASALTLQGAARVAADTLGRDVAEHEVRDLDLDEILACAHPSLLDPKIGSDAVAPPLSEQERARWTRVRGGQYQW
jgi:hypothetical protein